ncbi:uncharacterized protein K02A2.6-like [Galendromus occidentalis]|uniref:RNA-directed DNA polymerase n=1 Tax=Galendromus occidentalis TaxID=34638 RepID=A0AAJ6QSX8_9ACAR|nr:uncharacterized protein K02A2.6-like [Galendromus occidentalis]
MEAALAQIAEALKLLQAKTEAKPIEDRVVALNNVLSLIGTFNYEPGNGQTFNRWFKRNEPYLSSHCNSDDERRQLILKALGPREYNQLRGRTSPEQPESKLVEEIVNSTKLSGDDFEFSKLTLQNFNIFIMLLQLSDPSYKSLRGVIMRSVDEKPDITLEELRTVMRRFETRTVDTVVDSDAQKTVKDEPVVFAAKAGFSGKKRANPKSDSAKPPKRPHACPGCGGDHFRKDCKFREAKCNTCRKVGHLAKVCRSAQTNSVQVNQMLNRAKLDEGRTFVTLSVNGKKVTFRADSGADISTMNHDTWNGLGAPRLAVYDSQCTHVDGGSIRSRGFFNARFQFNDKSLVEPVLVLESGKANLLCGRLLKQLGIVSWKLQPEVQINGISTSSLTSRFPNLFETGLGTCTKLEVHLQLAPNAVPVHLRPRPVAFALQESIDKELDRLVQNGTLIPVDSSDWATPIVVVKKPNGAVRVCADYSTGLNDALVDIEHPLPNMEEVMTKFSGNKIFAHLDLADAYLQLRLDTPSQQLTTITTHRGLFRYTRLVFGLKTAPAIFQKTIDQALAGLDGVLVYLDDILIMAPNYKLYEQRLVDVLRRLEDWGFRLRIEKCFFNVPTVKYLGMVISDKGIEADPARIAVIKNLRKPANQKEVRALLGLVNYYGKFVKNLHRFKTPLEALLAKDARFEWGVQHDAALTGIKDMLCGPLLLSHYDPRQTLVVAADASQTGIGGVLLQRYADGNERAVFHMSKSLSKSQRNYSQVEKEAFALVTAVERFKKFVWGRRFILQTDHRPLLALFRTSNTKGLQERTAARLKRWALRLVGFDFEIEYIRTEEFGQADALSRLIAEARDSTTDSELEEVVANLDQSVETELEAHILALNTEESRHRLGRETELDPILSKVIRRLSHGWAEADRKDPHLRPFLNAADSLCLSKNILLLNERVVVPKAMQPTVLEQLHLGHPGIRRMKSLARLHFYWPAMASDVEHVVRSCSLCIDSAANPVRVPLAPWPNTDKVWSRIHIDFGEPKRGKTFVVVVDSFSKYVDAQWLPALTAAGLISYLRQLFRHFGPPDTIVSDNGAQFTSQEFAQFCSDLNIIHLRCAPRMPMSNGLAERMVRTIKSSLDASAGSLDSVISAYNYTPNATINDDTPARKFFGVISRPRSTSTSP